MQSQGKTGHRSLWQGKQLAHGSSKAEDCDLIHCLNHLQINSFPGTYQGKKSPGLCFLKQYFTKQGPDNGDRLPGDIVRPRKDKSFLKRMVENIHCHIVVMTIFSRYGPQLHMFVWRKEDKNERIFLYHYHLIRSHCRKHRIWLCKGCVLLNPYGLKPELRLLINLI